MIWGYFRIRELHRSSAGLLYCWCSDLWAKSEVRLLKGTRCVVLYRWGCQPLHCKHVREKHLIVVILGTAMTWQPDLCPVPSTGIWVRAFFSCSCLRICFFGVRSSFWLGSAFRLCGAFGLPTVVLVLCRCKRPDPLHAPGQTARTGWGLLLRWNALPVSVFQFLDLLLAPFCEH